MNNSTPPPDPAQVETHESEAKPEKATKKERFDLGIEMMKAYYDAIEARMYGSVTLMVVVIGWLLVSDSTRRALSKSCLLVVFFFFALTGVLLLYAGNISHWIGRWQYIRKNVVELDYMEPKFYTRYERLGPHPEITYVMPMLLIYLVAVMLLGAIGAGLLVDTPPG